MSQPASAISGTRIFCPKKGTQMTRTKQRDYKNVKDGFEKAYRKAQRLKQIRLHKRTYKAGKTHA